MSFIELGVGFNPELTGRENVYMNGAMLGFSTTEIDAMYDDIVDFAELHEFMNQKLKNYSSGMQVCLAFSVAIKAQGDILILDEVLAVGDEAFQRKCNDYFKNGKKSGKTTILVTHDMGPSRNIVTRLFWLKMVWWKQLVVLKNVANQYSFDNTAPLQQGGEGSGGANPNHEEQVLVENFSASVVKLEQITPPRYDSLPNWFWCTWRYPDLYRNCL